MKVVCDLRTFPYFRARQTSQEPAAFLNDDKIDRLLEFHPRITYNSEAIDSINRKEIFNLDSWKTQHQVLQWLFDESEARGAWKRIIQPPQRAYPSGRLLSYLTQLPIRIKDRALIKKYEERIRNSVVIHARFGNGEVERFLHYWPGRKPPRTLRRLQISADKFIKEMEKYDEDFKYLREKVDKMKTPKVKSYDKEVANINNEIKDLKRQIKKLEKLLKDPLSDFR